MGCYEVSLGDTLGVGVANDVRCLLSFLVASGIFVEQLAGHFHDTYGQAVVNVWAAYECGVRVFDSSVGGLGGCPYAPGAKGNVATEDLVYMFHQSQINTGIDLGLLVDTGEWISQQLSKPNESRAGSALAAQAKRLSLSKPDQSPAANIGIPSTLSRDTDGLLVHRSGPSIKITLNRPRNGNALTTTMIEQLTNLYEDASRDQSITRIAITANGKYFCTGMDLSKDSTPVGRPPGVSSPVAGAGASSTTTSASAAQFERLSRLFRAIDSAPQVTIACIQGPAFGGGVGLAFACDIRLAVRTATMTLSEVKLGLCPATISPYVFREWGIAFAREAMLSARPVAVEQLVAIGAITGPLANSDAELAASLPQYLHRRLRHAAPRASAMCKTLALRAWQDPGGPRQAEDVRALFDEMMSPESPESAHSLKQFQSGNKAVDWDAYAARKFAPKL